MSGLIFNLYKILFLTVFISFFSQGSFSEVISEEDPTDEIDFLSAMKGFERDSEFIDQESTYTDTDYIKNYESGDEKMFALLAAQSGVLDETVKKNNELMAKIEKDDLVMALGRSPTIL